MPRIDLPSGAYAELRDPGTLKAKHRKQIARAMHGSTREIAVSIDIIDGVIAILVVEWDAADPETGQLLALPSVDLESLEEMSDDDYEMLAGHPLVAATAQRILKARVDVADNPDGWNDPASPTEPSAASTPGSAEGDPSPAVPSRKSTRSSKQPGSRSATAGRSKSSTS